MGNREENFLSTVELSKYAVDNIMEKVKNRAPLSSKKSGKQCAKLICMHDTARRRGSQEKGWQSAASKKSSDIVLE